MSTVLIDGYDLGLEEGDRSRHLCPQPEPRVAQSRARVLVLYRQLRVFLVGRTAQEVSLDGGRGERSGTCSRCSTSAIMRRAARWATAVEVPMIEICRVVARAFDAKMPFYDRIYNAPDVFSARRARSSCGGGLSTVRVPEKPDLAHWTYPLPLRIKGRPNIYTLHDIVPLRLPYTTLDHKRDYLKLLRQLDRHADHFVTVSECSKNDLIEILGISPERVTNTYQSVDILAALRDKPEEQVAREVEGLAGVGFKDYFLFWGSIEPKKNIGRMIESYLVSKVDAPLVIVGAQAWKSKRELQLLNDGTNGAFGGMDQGNVSRKGIVRLPYAPFGLLVSLIRGAKAALFLRSTRDLACRRSRQCSWERR